MKKLIIINGTIGVGKSATCRALLGALPNSVWLCGDWCWMMDPLVASDENRKMVEDNIIHTLRNFLANSSFRYVIFDWVMDREGMSDVILRGLADREFELHKITLTCSEECLRARIRSDVKKEARAEDAIERGVERLERYRDQDTQKIDTTDMTVAQTVEEIRKLITR